MHTPLIPPFPTHTHTHPGALTWSYQAASGAISPQSIANCVGSQSGSPSTHPAPLRVPSVHIYVCVVWVFVCMCVCGCKQAKEHANISFARWQVNTEVEVNAGRGGAKWHWPKMKWKARPGEQTQQSNSHVCVAVIGSP